MKYRQRVLAFLFVLSIIAYVDRICFAVAGPRMQQDLSMTPAQFGWVMGVFAIAYAAFEIPVGAIGDRIGPRKVLTRLVVWWSVFILLTGTVWSFAMLLPVIFLFGMGEAGAFPNASGAISRWFPVSERARATGVMWMASRLGGAITPFMVIPLQMRFGWRASFFCFGCIGVAWAVCWYLWYRDYPSEKPGVTKQELAEIGHSEPTRHGLHWGMALRNPNLLAIMFMYLCYCYSSFFFLSWLPTYLHQGRGWGEKDLVLATLPFLMGALGNLCGGFTSDFTVRRLGLKAGRRLVAMTGLGCSALFIAAAAFTADRTISLCFLALSFGCSDFMLPSAWAVCLDIGKKYAGAVTGAMNTAGQIGSFMSSVMFGYVVLAAGEWLPAMGIPVKSGARDIRYDAPLVVISAMVTISTLVWLRIDPTKQLIPAESADQRG